MSKFYYQGKIQQENFLTEEDQRLRRVYGKYQLMILEGFSYLFFSVLALLFYFFHLENYIGISNIYPRALGSVFIFLAVTFEITYRFILKKSKEYSLRTGIIFSFVVGLILIIFPGTLSGFWYSLLAISSLIYGTFSLLKRNKSGFQIIKSIIFIALGLFFTFFPVQNNYRDIVFFILVGLFGVHVIVDGFRFRSHLRPFEDEQKGFTDYKIEN